jgi:hypothetical protein
MGDLYETVTKGGLVTEAMISELVAANGADETNSYICDSDILAEAIGQREEVLLSLLSAMITCGASTADQLWSALCVNCSVGVNAYRYLYETGNVTLPTLLLTPQAFAGNYYKADLSTNEVVMYMASLTPLLHAVVLESGKAMLQLTC